MTQIRPIDILVSILLGSDLTLLALTLYYRKDWATIRELNLASICVSVALIVVGVISLYK